MAINKTNINEVEQVFAKLDLALVCEEQYSSLKQFDWVVYAILKNQEGLSKRSYLMGNRSYVDKYDNVFVRISQQKLAKLLKTSIPTLKASLDRLVKVDLLEVNVVGKNECNIMYVGNPIRTITFSEYVDSIGKALEDEKEDFKPTINVDNVKDLKVNKKASTVAPVEAHNPKKQIDNNIIPQNSGNDTKKDEDLEIINLIKESCINVRKADLIKYKDEFADINKFKEAITICESRNSHGIKALRLAYKTLDNKNTFKPNFKPKYDVVDSKVLVDGKLKSVRELTDEQAVIISDYKFGNNFSGKNPNREIKSYRELGDILN